MLVIVGESNPVFSAPADWKFGEALRKVPLRAHSGLFHDETAALCQWHVPATHSARDVGRCAHGRRHRHHRPAADPAALRRPLAARDHRDPVGSAGAIRLRHRARILAGTAAGAHGDPRQRRDAGGGRADPGHRRAGQPAGRQHLDAGEQPGRRRAPGPQREREHGPPARRPATDVRRAGRQPHGGDAVRQDLAPVAARRRGAGYGLRAGRGDAGRQLGLGGRPGRGSGRHHGRAVPPRPVDLRRPLRQQRLAAGTAEAGHQADLGQRRPDRPGHRREAARRGRRLRHRPARRPQPARAGVDHARPRRRHADSHRRLRPHARGPRRQRHRLRHVRAARLGRAVVRRCRGQQGQRQLRAGQHAGPLVDRRPQHRPLGDPRGLQEEPEVRRRDGAPRHQPRHHALSQLGVQGQRLGNGNRPQHVHGLQRLRRRLRRREQHPRRRQGPGRQRPRDALAAHRPLLRRRARQPRHLLPADAVPAVRERALRGRLPGRGHRPLGRGPQRHGLQPLRGHPLLLEQLPVEGAAVQLHPLLRTGTRRSSSCSATPTSPSAAAA